MNKLKSLAISGTSIALGCSLSVFGFAAEDYTAPRTEWGQPDLQGVWNFSSNVPMERPARYGEREFLTEQEIADALAQLAEADANSDAANPSAGVDESYNDFWLEGASIGDTVRTSHIVYPKNGRIPDLQEGVRSQIGTRGSEATGESRPARVLARGIGADGPEDRGLSERCLVGFNAGPPFTPSIYNNNVQIFLNRDSAVLMIEMIHDARIVPLYDSAEDIESLHDDIRLYSGDSRGYWDGDTLVVVTKNFNDLTTSFGGLPASIGQAGTAYDKVLTEKFSRVGPYTVDYEFTVNDPSTYTDKFTGVVSMTKVAGLLYEYACHEGNYGMTNILRGARMQEKLGISER